MSRSPFLKGRGFVCADEALVRRWLITVEYYRLSAYWLPYERTPPASQTRSKMFAPSTLLEPPVDIYTSDRQLRLLVMEAMERIVIALRASWTGRTASRWQAGYTLIWIPHSLCQDGRMPSALHSWLTGFRRAMKC